MEQKVRKRAKVMLPVIKLLITTRALSEPDKGREQLAGELVEDIERQFPKEIPPAWETVIKLISKARNEEGWPLALPWHMDTLREYDLNSAVIPLLLREQVKRTDENRHPVTIGEALWASRLYSTIAALLSDKPEEVNRAVIYWAEQYTADEGVAYYAKTDFDSSELDRNLVNAPEPVEGALTIVGVPVSVLRMLGKEKRGKPRKKSGFDQDLQQEEVVQ